MKKTTHEQERVYCRNCKKSAGKIGNGNYCEAKKRRVCSCDRYGKFCEDYEAKN